MLNIAFRAISNDYEVRARKHLRDNSGGLNKGVMPFALLNGTANSNEEGVMFDTQLRV